jgi:hypothetical protein
MSNWKNDEQNSTFLMTDSINFPERLNAKAQGRKGAESVRAIIYAHLRSNCQVPPTWWAHILALTRFVSLCLRAFAIGLLRRFVNNPGKMAAIKASAVKK